MNKKKAQFALLLTVFIDLLGFGIVIPILPLYAKYISDNPSSWMTSINAWMGFANPAAFWAGLAMISFTTMQFIASPILGRLSDQRGRRPILFISLLGSSLGYLVLGLTMNYEWVIAARILDGLTGGNIAVAQAAMADLSTPEERSKSLGLIGAAFGMGFVLGPALAGVTSGSAWGIYLLDQYGLHLPFLIACGLSLLASVLVLVYLPETLSVAHQEKTRRENRTHAILHAWRTPKMPSLLIISLLTVTGFGMMEGSFSLMANERFGFGQREVGYLFGLIGILIAVYQGGLIRLATKYFKDHTLLLMGLSSMIVAFLLLPVVPWGWPFLLAIVPSAWGSGMNNTATFTIASKITPPEDQGSLFGVLGAVQGLGRILGPAIGTVAFAKYGYQMPFHVAVLCLSLSVVLALNLFNSNSESVPR